MVPAAAPWTNLVATWGSLRDWLFAAGVGNSEWRRVVECVGCLSDVRDF
jgi:hypothetical protein